ncbi:calpastatin isoform X5 [Myotis myotis]|uniref:calpastatin isoform X5 n=1 Tax=Myotis myotis TaxID=51298 RepID=UPI00174CD532|nr:calpastatin isoform X5 [Myotis myotis]
MAFASWWYKTHVYEKDSGSPSRSGEKKGADEKKATSHESSQPSRTHAGGRAPATKVSTSSASTSKSSSMNTTENKAIPVSKQTEGTPPPHKKRHKKQAVKSEPEKKSQSTEVSVPPLLIDGKKIEKKPKEQHEPENLSKSTSHTASKHGHKEKAVSRPSEQPTSEKPSKPKTKSQDTGGKSAAAATAGVVVASGKSDDKKEENKSLMSAVPVESKPGEPSGKSGMDAALDDLVDTLGEPEETEHDNTTYTGPEVSDPMTSIYIEELGKREGSIPPKYRELLDFSTAAITKNHSLDGLPNRNILSHCSGSWETGIKKKEGITRPPPDSPKPPGPDDAIDALSSDFTCSSPTTGGKETEKEKSTGEVLKAQSAGVIRSAAPPHEKKRKVEKDAMSDQALEALSASLGRRKSEPELDLSSIEEVDEAKSKEEKREKCGEDDETVPEEYRLKPAMDKDGKPLLPEPEEKSKPRSESELIDELSEDFDQAKCKEKPSKPTEKTEEPQAAAPAPVGEDVPRASLCSVQSAPPKPAALKGMVPDDAVEALAGSLGKREADPEDGKPAEDKVKEKTKEEDREKLGEKEETIPPDYRLEEAKDQDGKPLLPKESKESLPPLSEDFLLDALSKDFGGPPDTSPLKPLDNTKLTAAISELVSQTPAATTHSAGPPPSTLKDKELDDALDQLSDSLGQRQPDPDEDKPIKDKVKERAKAEHRDKLGERDDTIPPEYRHLLDNDDKKPADDQDPIDSLSGDFDNCSSSTETSENTAKDKDKKTASSSKAPKNGGKAKNSAKAKEETSKPKADEKNTS